ncbi:MAG: hypothetical protein VX293_08140 [Candidatus Latescibacterota bacterium]|nr:hypothetical protein [Candidatus Latescibacterota bacterium]
MRVTVIGADRPLGAALASGLGDGFAVAAIGVGEVGDVDDYQQVDLLEREALDAALAGAEAIVHAVAFDPEAENEQALLDFVARSTYVALTAAVAAGVGRAVLISRLDLVRDYPQEYVVGPQWNAIPRADAGSLVPMLAELTGREIARMGQLEVRCLRLGELGGETMVDDAVAAVRNALVAKREGHHWSLEHVASSGRCARGA